ncbi:MAG TPA: MFS transporter [Vicinamibacterales bacterium]|nr:MFS transporter [Vicinamibacterales bacterium]
MHRLAAKLGLNRPELRAWALYDFANSAFQTTIVAAVFPIYFQRVAASGLPASTATSRFAWATTIAICIVAIVAPILGAMADTRRLKKPLLGMFLGIGAGATAAMYAVQDGDWMLALVLFIIGNVGVAGSIVFYESLLPHIARGDELDRVSTAGYAIGYLGGGILLAFNLAMIQQPQWFGIADSGVATRLSFVSVAVWWVLFAWPLFRRVPEPPVKPHAGARTGSVLAQSLRQLAGTFRELRKYRQALLLLFAFFLYNDGIQTIIRMAAIYGSEVGIDQSALIGALLLVQFVGVPCSFAFGALAGVIGPKRAVMLGLAVYLVILAVTYYMTSAREFYILAGAVGMVQGGTQGLSRSMFASMIPRHKSSEFFAFFGVFERYAGVMGPAIFAIMAGLGTSRTAILTLIPFFVGGMLLLARVDVAAGRREAAAAEGELTRG